MAYGRKKLTGSTRTRAKRVRVPRAPKTNKGYVRKNAKAVNSLYRSVRSLKMSQYGSKQVGYHKMTTHVTPVAAQPVLFDMLDFSCRHPAGGIQIPSGYFYQVTTAGLLGEVAGWESCQPNNLFWEGERVDIPDTGKMLACDMAYTFRIEGISSLDDTRVRIDIFQQKTKVYYVRPSTAQGGVLALPHSLAGLDNMATPTLNRLNGVYFKKIKTIWKYFNSKTTEDQSTQTTANIQYASFRMKPNMLIQQIGTAPAVVNNASDVVVTGGQWGIYNKPLNQSLWCLISTDDRTALASDQVRVTVTRKVIWRDSVGGSQLDGRL